MFHLHHLLGDFVLENSDYIFNLLVAQEKPRS